LSYTYNFDTDPILSQVRMLIPDTMAPWKFTDQEVNQFIYLESSQGLYVSGQAAPTASSQTVLPQVYSVRRAAAMGLDIIASKLSQLAGVEQILDVKLSLAAGARAAADRAQCLRDQEAKLGSFAIAEMVNDEFSARERVYAQMLRIEAN